MGRIGRPSDFRLVMSVSFPFSTEKKKEEEDEDDMKDLEAWAEAM